MPKGEPPTDHTLSVKSPRYPRRLLGAFFEQGLEGQADQPIHVLRYGLSVYIIQSSMRHALTIDVEEYFQIHAFAGIIP
ncbi:MAG: hypothetical protein M0R18_04795, partial [Deltaproteobacteria bacterium]|nr:hypothetical protein [Deltaproteobacteria bacterium]